MKKFIVIILMLSVSLGAIAQMGKVTSALSFIDQGLLDKAKENLDQAVVHEKSKDHPTTYYALGRLYQEIGKSTDPKYKDLVKNPLEEAYAAYEKALKMDPKGGIKKQMSLNSTYLTLGNDFINQGVQKYEAKDYEGALNSFDYNIKIASSDIYVGVIDSGVYYNAGLAAFNGKLYEKAIPYFQKCAEMKYEGTMPYFLIYNCYMNLKEMEKAEETLQNVFKLYPDDKDVVMQLVDFYINNNKLDQAFEYLKTAKDKNPNDYTLWWAEGVIYMRQEKYDDAIRVLTKSVEIKGDEYNTQFNLGVSYYNKAVEMFQKANDIMDVNKYNAAVEEANKVFVKAIPYFEKANQLNPTDVDTMKNLKELYFRLRAVYPEYESKYNEILKKLEGK
jgi:tetratricopeptide (TPR) repeat protein